MAIEMLHAVSLPPHPLVAFSNPWRQASRQWVSRNLMGQSDGQLFFPNSWRQADGRSPSLLQKARKAQRWSLSAASYAPTSSRRPNVNTDYERVGECLVFPSYAKRKKPRAIIHLIGGAFIGAVPEVTYSLFIELLAKQDFLIVATPYNVTFEHAVAAEDVHRKFRNCRAFLTDAGFSPAGLAPEDIAGLPVFCVGHSNGALLQLLIGSLFQEDLPKANAIIAFNNKPAADAIPYFEQLGPLTAQLTPSIATSPFLDLARGFSGDPLKSLLDAASPILPKYDEDSLRSLQKFTEQIPSVLDQISRGLSEFTPAPSENRGTIGSNYSVRDTLLVKYKVDGIDESDIMEDILRPRVEDLKGGLKKLTLNGNHITPCVQDIKWEVGNLYTPVDAVGQVFKSIALADIRETVTSISNWFETLM